MGIFLFVKRFYLFCVLAICRVGLFTFDDFLSWGSDNFAIWFWVVMGY